jgi:hypothetical protein
MKRWTATSLLVGAIPGAIPPLIGWSAATGRVELPGPLARGAELLLCVKQIAHAAARAGDRATEGRHRAQRRELLRRQRLLCDQKCHARIEIASAPFEDGARADVTGLDQITHRQIDLTPGRLSCADDRVLHGRKKRLRPGRVGPLPDFCVHSVFCHHFHGNLRR